MQKTNSVRLAGAVIALAVQLHAGGFYLQVASPDGNPEARKLNAVLTIKVGGCHDPANGSVTAMAVGYVNGERRSVPLNVRALSEAGAFALTQEWPREGKWIIYLTGRSDGGLTSTLVAAGPEGVGSVPLNSERRPFTIDEIDAMLRR